MDPKIQIIIDEVKGKCLKIMIILTIFHFVNYFIGFCNTHVNFYKVAGLLSSFHAELTKFSSYDLQFDLNSRDFDSLIEIVLLCLQNAASQEPSDWDFLTNCEYKVFTKRYTFF